MKEYEVIVESINPCGGEKYANKEVIEVEAESPEAYVRENGRFPIIDIIEKGDDGITIVTGNERGYRIRYNFSE